MECEIENSPKRARRGSGRVRLEDVAEKANVSTATVSRVFNQPDKVSDSIRLRVIEVAKALNWIPNAAGRALASRRTHIAGAIIPTLDNEIFARQVSGMQSIFAERGFTLLLGCSNYDPNETLGQVQEMLARGAEALAIVGLNHSPAVYEALRLAKVPFTLLYSYRKNYKQPCVGFDNNEAFQVITRHLLSLGHRKFGAIFQSMTNNDRAVARLEGVRTALARENLIIEPKDFFVGPPTFDCGAECFGTLMSGPPENRPTAIICGNDSIALGALASAATLGLEAPADFSITGFDDLSISSRLSPPLTTMKIDNQKIGTLAAEELLAVIDGIRAVPRTIEIMPELKIRKSTGAVPPS